MHIVVKGVTAVTNTNDAKRYKTISFKNNAPFSICIPKINIVLTPNAVDLDVVIPMYNLLEYSKNYKNQQVACGIITNMNQVILFLLILNLFSIREVLQEILMMVMMMQIKLVKMRLKLLYH